MLAAAALAAALAAVLTAVLAAVLAAVMAAAELLALGEHSACFAKELCARLLPKTVLAYVAGTRVVEVPADVQSGGLAVGLLTAEAGCLAMG